MTEPKPTYVTTERLIQSITVNYIDTDGEHKSHHISHDALVGLICWYFGCDRHHAGNALMSAAAGGIREVQE